MSAGTFLSIGIPTWNRCQCLQKNILSLIAQIESLQLTNIEILVSDNASTDTTENICRQLASQYSYITYHRHPENRGANVNFQTVLTLGKGEYVWLLGDDDLIAEKILIKLMKDIAEYNPDIVIGAALFDDSQQKATHLSVHDIQLTSKEVFYQENIIELAGKISGVIFKKESVLPCFLHAEDIVHNIKTPWPHLAWIILLLNNPNHHLLLLPYGINQLVSNNWHNLLFTGKELISVHFIEQQKLLLALKPMIAAEYYNKLIDVMIAHRVSILLKCLLYASYLDSNWHTLCFSIKFFPTILGFKNKIYYCLFLLLPLCLPNSIRRVLFVISGFLSGNKKLRKTIARLKIARKIKNSNAGKLRAFYDNAQL